MIKVNFRDGTTLGFDLNSDDDRQQWEEWSSASEFQSNITGIGIVHNNRFLTFPFPRGFKTVKFYAGLVYSNKKGQRRLIAEQLVCHADEIKHTMLVYTFKDPPPPILCRVHMERIGKQMFPGVIGG